MRTRVRVGSTVETNGGVSKGKKTLKLLFLLLLLLLLSDDDDDRRRKRRIKSGTEWNRIDRQKR